MPARNLLPPRRALLALPFVVAALVSAGCDTGALAPCVPDADVTVDATPVSLRAVQRDVPGLDDGCRSSAPVRLTLVGRSTSAVAFAYRVTWRGPHGTGWFVDGTVTRLAPGAIVDVGTMPDAAALGTGVLAVDLANVRDAAP